MDLYDLSTPVDTTWQSAADSAWNFGVGPQTDGTNIYSPTAIIPQPTDAAGGAPANYGQAVLDIFKQGIGAWTATQQSQQLFDYKKFEATNGGLYQQGRTAMLPYSTQGGGISGLTLLVIGALVMFALSTHKG